jgi:ribosomal L13e-like protein
MPKIAEKPIVKYFRKGISITRLGRGFSVTEIRQSGIVNPRLARSRGIPVDNLRTSTYPENVEKLSSRSNEARTSVNQPEASEKPLSRKSTTKAESNTKKIPQKKSDAPKKGGKIGKIIRKKKTQPGI